MSPGPGKYDPTKGLKFVKGKIAPNITMGHRFNRSFIRDSEALPGPGAYDNKDEI